MVLCNIASLSIDILTGACWLKYKIVAQALLTTRKGKKRFAMYDLTITLTWEGLWVEDDNKQVIFVYVFPVCICPSAFVLCESATTRSWVSMSRLHDYAPLS